MNCPNCHEPLHMSERNGIEVDYCPRCRGVWLDRGELDKIIERSLGQLSAADHTGTYKDQPHKDQPYYRKKKNLLGEIFDF